MKLYVALAYVFLSDKRTGQTCDVGNGHCEQNCTMLTGDSYVCHCFSGYTISPTDGKSCLGKFFYFCLIRIIESLIGDTSYGMEEWNRIGCKTELRNCI